MLATASDLPRETGDYGFEYKWDGVRTVVRHTAGELRLWSRNRNDMAGQFPELAESVKNLAGRTIVLDGEVVAFGPDGVPDFGRLQARLGVADRSEAELRATRTPVSLLIFDILWIDGNDLRQETYVDRRRALEELELDTDVSAVPRYYRDNGQALLRASQDRGLEGIMAKELGSRYESGRRSGAWLKIKHSLRQEFVVGGWSEGEGSRRGRFGSLLLGYYDDGGDLVYVGRVGTGFDRDDLVRIGARLEALASHVNPFAGGAPGSGDGVHFCQPRLVVEVEFRGWTQHDMLRQAAYKGLRFDKDPEEVGLEVREAAGPRAWEVAHAA